MFGVRFMLCVGVSIRICVCVMCIIMVLCYVLGVCYRCHVLGVCVVYSSSSTQVPALCC